MTDLASQDPPLHLAMDLGRRIAAASSSGLPNEELCRVVVDVGIAACRAAGMNQEEALAFFSERARRPLEGVPQP